ncbi:unnamed protein product, partial [Mesorhabditis belari]|uniref:Uncharacterized protein n=1 Tax=Mesorhabditis belari TaxID=2138241 RepID=A0AAF3EF13_9BILA
MLSTVYYQLFLVGVIGFAFCEEPLILVSTRTPPKTTTEQSTSELTEDPFQGFQSWDCDTYGIKEIRFNVMYNSAKSVKISLNKQKALCIAGFNKCQSNFPPAFPNDEATYFANYRDGKFDGCSAIM